MAPLSLNLERYEAQLITPSEPTPYEVKYLSDIDQQEILRSHAPNIFFYRKNEMMKGKDPVKIIKEAIARTLVYYYPFAGRLREGINRKLMVECTGEGVLFIEANANVPLDHFADALLPPFPDFLYDVPGYTDILNTPLLLIQVTRLTCGGFIFALRVNHSMCDAPGVAQLMIAIGEMARNEPVLSVQPVWNRELLTAPDPPHVTCNKVPALDPYIMPTDIGDKVHGSFFFGPDEISVLRTHVPSSNLCSCSAFEIVTACLWRCLTVALGPNDPKKVVCLVYAINVRNKLNPPLPVGYYGNALLPATAESKVGELCHNPLGYALELVRKGKAAVTEDYGRSLVNHMEGKAKVPCSPSVTFIVSDVRHARFEDVDFGWGKPVYAGPANGDPRLVSVVVTFYLPTQNNKGQDGLAATISLPRTAMESFTVELHKFIRNPPAPRSATQIKGFTVSARI